LRLWSAGCSSGEEPYTLAMLLHQRLGNLQDVDVFGNDISRKVLRSARQGFYRETSFRQTPKNFWDGYFTPENQGWQLVDEIKKAVSFGHLNLVNERAVGILAQVDVIFCRNVLIYFGEESRKKLVQLFYRKLKPGGYLLLGHS